MNLSNEARDNFVRLVMAATPWKHTMDDTDVKLELSKRLFAALPADVAALHAKYPDMLAITTLNAEHAAKAGFPERHPIELDHYRQPLRRYWHARCPAMLDCELRIGVKDLVNHVLARDAEILERNDLRTKLLGVARSCRTLKQLQAALPELVAYMPKENVIERAVALAPLDLIPALKKAGLKMQKPPAV